MTSQVAVRLARAAQWKNAAALAGAALIVFGYFRRASWDTASAFARDVEEIWAIWSPLEALGAVILAVLAVVASRRGGAVRDPVDGVLLGVGVIVAAAMVAFIASTFEFADTAKLTALGAVAIGASGMLGVLTRRAPEVGLSRRARVLATTGVVLVAAPLIVNVGEWSSSGLLEEWEAAYYIEPLVASVAAALALAALLRVPRARVHGGGALIALGTLTAFHYVGLMVQIAKYEGFDALRYGGALGVAGGILLLAAGVGVLRGGREAETPEATPAPA